MRKDSMDAPPPRSRRADADRPFALDAVESVLSENFGLGPWGAMATLAGVAAAVAFSFFWFFHAAPPDTIVITGGPKGSSFHRQAERYAPLLKRSRVNLRIIPSEGAGENLKRLADPAARVDVGFVESRPDGTPASGGLVSLGSVSHQPLMVFYRGARSIDRLSELEGRRLSIGPDGGGTRALALDLLAANGIRPGGSTVLMALEPAAATEALLAGKIDAAFLMGDSASLEILGRCLRAPGVRLLGFGQADSYVRRFGYLNKMILSRGGIDLAKDIPSSDVVLIGSTVELVARPGLDPALTDLLLEAAREVHGGAGLFKSPGEFPSPQTREYPLSPAAARFYKSGKSFFYRSLPFWLASFIDRVLVAFVPLLVVLIPGLRSIPAFYRWRVNLRIFKWYRALLALEREMLARPDAAKREELARRLDRIEASVNALKVPAPFANQFYELRGHIGFVRAQLASRAPR